MMAYDQVVSALNTARLRGTPFPVIHALIDTSIKVDVEVSLSLYQSA
jgi:nuclear pore complex protein Nup93